MRKSKELVVESPLTGYVAASKDGTKTRTFGSVNYQQALENQTVIGSGGGRNWQMNFTNPEVALTPMGCDIGWPCRLYEVEAPADTPYFKTAAGLCVAAVRVVAERNSDLILGPQADELMAMGAMLLTVTKEQQKELSEAASQFSVSMTQGATKRTRDLAEQNGRFNTTAVLNMMWTGEGIWARMPISHAAIAVAHRDLLVTADQQEDYQTLYQPWLDVMGVPETPELI